MWQCQWWKNCLKEVTNNPSPIHYRNHITLLQLSGMWWQRSFYSWLFEDVNVPLPKALDATQDNILQCLVWKKWVSQHVKKAEFLRRTNKPSTIPSGSYSWSCWRLRLLVTRSIIRNKSNKTNCGYWKSLKVSSLWFMTQNYFAQHPMTF